MQLAHKHTFRNAPLLVGAFFLFLALTSCEKERSTATWVTKSTSEEAYESVAAEPASPEESAPTGETVRFLSYNLKNYLTMRRGSSNLSKPEDEISPLVALIARQKPDILGVCEIGSEDDLADLQRRLKNAGIDLPHSEHTGGRDKTRRLGLLSRYPIAFTNSQSELTYEMTGKTWTISRGILDATVDIKGTL